MNPYIEQLKKHLTEHSPVNIQDLLELLYFSYSEHRAPDGANVRECMAQLNACTQHLLFKEQDSILCAAVALGAAYEHQAFLDGLQAGAGLIFALHKQ